MAINDAAAAPRAAGGRALEYGGSAAALSRRNSASALLRSVQPQNAAPARAMAQAPRSRAFGRASGWPVGVLVACWLLAIPCALVAQQFEQRGYLDTLVYGYPQVAPNDSAHAVGETLLRWEPSVRFTPWFKLLSSFDARTDTHHETERAWRLDWRDRTLQRPAFSVRRLSGMFNYKGLNVEVGKQFIRWGKADILNPTDRFAPRDFLTVSDNDFLAVSGARVTWEVKADTFDAVCVPFFTPSRTPLLNQRWTAFPVEASGLRFKELAPRYPGGSQFGVRWNHVATAFEYSLSFYQGFNHLPVFEGSLDPLAAQVNLRRFFPAMRMVGGDAAIPLRSVTIKTEAAYFTSSTPDAENYGLYVIQLERQTGEWSFVGGYAGEFRTRRSPLPQFAFDRGLARAFLGRATYTIDARRSVAFEAAARQNGRGLWLKSEYSQLFGQHWRTTAGWVWIHGADSDFLGQFHHNSHATLSFRYSF